MIALGVDPTRFRAVVADGLAVASRPPVRGGIMDGATDLEEAASAA